MVMVLRSRPAAMTAAGTVTAAGDRSATAILASGLFGHGTTVVAAASMTGTLKGLFTDTDGRGLAIIDAGNGRTVVLAPGDRVPGGSRIEAIHAHSIVLRTARGRSVVPLHEPQPGIEPGVSGPAGVQPPPGRHDDGYRITAALPQAVRQRTGLRVGDVVTAVDGRPLHDPINPNTLSSWWRRSQPVSLTVRRGGRTLHLHAGRETTGRTPDTSP